MKTLSILGLVALLSVVGFGLSSAAPNPVAPTHSSVSEYVYLHVTRSEAISVQTTSRAGTCYGTSTGVRS